MTNYRFDDAPTGGAGFEAMTFPRFRPLLRRVGRDVRVHARAVWNPSNRPVGLALATVEPDGVHLLSLFVRKEDRHHGLATALLNQIEHWARREDATRLFLSYMSGGPSGSHLERLLHRAGWTEPDQRSLVIRTDYEHVKTAPWMKERRLPRGMALVSWFRLEPDSLRALMEQDWVPADLDPFRHEGRGVDGAMPEPAVSTALVDGTSIRGWCLTHRLGAHGIRFTSSFVHPDLQRRMLVAALWRHCVLKAVEIGFREASWTVPVEHPAMRRFADKYMVPHALETRLTMQAEKILSITEATHQSPPRDDALSIEQKGMGL